jgi:uncharacterized membrane protein
MKELYFIGSLPWWVIALAAFASGALLAIQFHGLKQRLTVGQSLFLVLLRAGVYALLFFFLFGPSLLDKRVARLRRPLTVMIDSSESMAFPATSASTTEPGSGQSRLAMVQEKLLQGHDPSIQKLRRDYDLRLYRVGTHLQPMAPESIGLLKPQDPGTRLLELLPGAAQEAGSLAGIVLFSDGITNGGPTALDGAPPLPVPVFTVGVGETEGFTDARIADLRAPEFAFRGREFKFDVTVRAHGLKGKTMPLYFNRGKNLITTRSLSIDADPFETKLTLSFTPKELGAHSFSLTLPTQPGEQIPQNNHKQFKVEVQRDKIRVLTLSGSPAWNYRFLRMALKQDPLIELVSFVFLRTPTDSVDVPDNQLSLIPFPIDDIFLEELRNFDVLVLDDFSHRAYFNPVYLERVRDFVRDGGGLAMFGGARSFDSGGYGETALREVLPVEMDGKGAYLFATTVRALLTPTGKAHPITRLLPDPRANEEAWAKLPSLTGLNRVRGGRGEILLSAGENGANAPLLAVGRYGKGRSFALMSDDSWRWNFIAVGNRETPQHHLKLIRQAIRWLAQELSFEQVQIRPIATARPGEKIAIKLRVLKDDFTPAPQASVQLRVFGPEGEPSLVGVTLEGEEGNFGGEYTPTRAGAYRVEAEASLGGKTLGKQRASFSAASSYDEIEDGRPRFELLKQIADSSKGEFFPIKDWNEKTLERIAAKLESHAPSQIVEQRETRLWSTLWTFSIIVALLSIEWWMRRKWGLV